MRCKNCGWENSPSSAKCEKCNAPLAGSMIANIEAPQPAAPAEPVNLKGTIPDSQFFGGGAAPEPTKQEVVEQFAHVAPVEPEKVEPTDKCKSCGFPVGAGMMSCPNCGSSLKAAEVKAAPKAEFSTEGPKAAKPEEVKCRQCGSVVAPGVKFCGECGTPIQLGTVNPWAKPDLGPTCSLAPIAWDGEYATPDAQSYSGELISLTRSNTDPNNQSITSQSQAELSYEDGEWYIVDKSAQQTTYVHAGEKMKLKSGDIVILGNRRFEFKA